MLPQTPVFFMNANALPHPPPQEPNKNKKHEYKKYIYIKKMQVVAQFYSVY